MYLKDGWLNKRNVPIKKKATLSPPVIKKGRKIKNPKMSSDEAIIGSSFHMEAPSWPSQREKVGRFRTREIGASVHGGR